MMRRFLAALFCLLLGACAHAPQGSGDLGLVIERATGSIQIIRNGPRPAVVARVEGLGDLSHATAVFSRDQRYAYVFGRDGGLTKVDMLTHRIAARVIQGGNSIGGAISQDGQVIAVGNYEPGGVRLFDAATLERLADIPATPLAIGGRNARAVGVVDAPGRQFVFSLFDTGEIWRVDARDPRHPVLDRHAGVGKEPYDGMITGDGRHYIAGLFGEDGLALLDLWHPEFGVRRILPDYGRRGKPLPVYKMPHLEGWSVTGGQTFIPGVGEHVVHVLDNTRWRLTDRIEVLGQPVFIVMRPDNRQAWVNFAFPDNGKVQVIDTESMRVIRTLDIGPGVLHMEFTPRGEQLWISVRDRDQVQVWDPYALERIATLPSRAPSGIFMSSRAARMGL
ncbi:hypothetical protein CDEN61S_02610 [Castellaniella denitrificans]